MCSKLFAGVVCVIAFLFGSVLAMGAEPFNSGYKAQAERLSVVLLRPQIDGWVSDTIHQPMLVATLTGVHRIPASLRAELGESRDGALINGLTPEIVATWPALSVEETETVRKLLSARKARLVGKSDLETPVVQTDLASIDTVESVDAALSLMPKETKNAALLLVGGYKVRDMVPVSVQIQFEKSAGSPAKVTMR